VAAAGVAGIGFGTGLSHAAVPPALIAAADRHGLPVLDVPRATPFLAITRAVARIIARRDLAAREYVFAAQRALTAAAVGPAGVAAVLDEVARLSGGWGLLLSRAGVVPRAARRRGGRRRRAGGPGHAAGRGPQDRRAARRGVRARGTRRAGAGAPGGHEGRGGRRAGARRHGDRFPRRAAGPPARAAAADRRRDVQRRALAPLRGDASRVDLLGSLRVWLSHHGQWDPAAAELGVHRHTLRKRMLRVEKLLGRRLDSADLRAELWVALNVDRTEEPATAARSR
jgi:DNA-binding PucR family transcriptional regulator